MEHRVDQALQSMLEYWREMKKSEKEDAEEDANQFEASFYTFIEAVKEWIQGRHPFPKSLDEALSLPEIQKWEAELPPMLVLNFETELELMVEGIEREEEARYD